MKYIIATNQKDFEAAKALFIEYSNWLNIDLCFQNFNKELDELNEMYSATNGGIVLCIHNDNYIACSAIRRIDNTTCELKRMWVQPNNQGKGIGEALLKQCIDMAIKLGYTTIKLDTLVRLQPAIQLYKKYNFIETTPYYNNPNANVVYMQKAI